MEKHIKRQIDKIKDLIRPTEAERKSIIENFNYVRNKVKDIGNVLLMGSVAKDTFLRNSNEIDVFVFIEKNKSIKTALNELKAALKNMKTEIAYAQHPYIRVYRGKIRIDIVPAYYIMKGEEIISQVDRTRLHLEYVKNHMREEQKDEVRLLKQFLKNINCYGAEIKIRGLSGYFCECLIIKKGNFVNALKYFSNMEFDIKDGFIHFPDPVDERRNIAASISNENLAKIVCASNAFFRKGNINAMDFFFFNLDSKKRKAINNNMKKHIFSIAFNKPDVVDDIRYGVLRKTAEVLIKHFEQEGINVINYYIDTVGKHDIMSFIVANKNINSFKILNGPNIMFKQHFNEFLKKHRKESKGLFLSSRGILLMKKRQYSDIKGLLKNAILQFNMKFYKNDYKIINKIPNFVTRELGLRDLIFGD
ncbi:MAG: CCA tRNA nucleotidyltransferase [Candidatus Anstonellales archaeon]